MNALIYLVIIFDSTCIISRRLARKAADIGFLGCDMDKLGNLMWQKWAEWIKRNQHHFSKSFCFLSADLLEGMTL